MMHVHGVKFGTPRQGRHGLVRVQQTIRVESFADSQELGQRMLIKLHTHPVDLLNTDAMFTGDGSPDRHAQVEYLCAELLSFFKFLRLVCVVKS